MLLHLSASCGLGAPFRNRPRRYGCTMYLLSLRAASLTTEMRSGYSAAMHRFAPSQADLFAPAAAPETAPERAPLVELAELLAGLRAAECLPWPDAAAAMAEEHRALGLARLAGAEGEKLAAAILEETERLFSAAEQDVARASAVP